MAKRESTVLEGLARFLEDLERTSKKAREAMPELLKTYNLYKNFLSPPINQAKKIFRLNPFQIVGVREDAPLELIRKVYLNKINYYHSDRGGDEEEAKRLNVAMEEIERIKGIK